MSDKQTTNRVGAVGAWVNKDSSRPVDMTEMSQFWRNCTAIEKQEFAEVSARELGVELQVEWGPELKG